MNTARPPEPRPLTLPAEARATVLVEALAICRGLETGSADRTDLLRLRGLLAGRANQDRLALMCLKRASTRDPSAACLADFGDVLVRSGDGQSAEAAYRQAMAVDPRDAALHGRLGRLLLRQHRAAARRGPSPIQVPPRESQMHAEEALSACQTAAALAPASARAHIDLGDVLRNLGRSAEAMQRYEQAIDLEPANAAAYVRLGRVQLRDRLWEPARETFQRGLHMQPGSADLHTGIGTALLRLGRVSEAALAWRAALSIDPAHARASRRLARALDTLGLRDEAVEAWLACAVACEKGGKLAAARSAYLEALARRPDSAKTLFGLGALSIQRARPRAALRYLNAALERRPDLFGAHLDVAWASGLVGDLKRTWREFAWCDRHREGARRRCFEQPAWTGEHLATGTVLVWADQALGDTIQFARYLQMVKARVVGTILECDARLVPLLAHVKGVDLAIARDRPSPAFDKHVRVSHLPRIFRSSRRTIPDAVPYLVADRELTERWRHRWAVSTLKTIGLVWTGEPTRYDAAVRFAPLEAFAPLASFPAARFVSLQIGPQAAELLAPPAGLGIERVLDDASTMNDTAAVIMNLDLVITVDTMIAHLAGALARPVWTLLPYVPEWRWQMRGDTSPWYPTMRVFRQRRRDDWHGLLEQVREALERWSRSPVSSLDREGAP
jgi:tetratricopeptide (TPR) repeat protein